MKRWLTLFALVVAAAVVVGWARARMRRAERNLPSFAQAPEPHFAELRAPLGDSQLRGRVVDVDRAPVAGVSLYLRSNDVPQWVISNDAGRFEFRELAAGEVEVVALAWNHPPCTQVLVAGGGEQELVLLPANPPLPRLPDVAYTPSGGRVIHPIGGRWSDPNGYEVVFVPRAAVSELGGAVERRVHTDASGYFALDDLAVGAYTVRVLPDWARGGSWPDLALRELADHDHAADALGGEIFPLSCGGLEVELSDTAGEPIEGALVLLRDAAQAAHVWLPQASDPLGRVRFLDLPPGDYALLVRAGEAQPPEIALSIASGDVTRVAVPPLNVRKRE